MIVENPKPISNEVKSKMEQYRMRLLEAGMLEPTKKSASGWHWLFYKPATALTAFIVNLQGNDCYVEVVYGYASTAFTKMQGAENALFELGISEGDITIREKVIICNDIDEEIAKLQISEMHTRYSQAEKDELLNDAKEKRKQFIQQIAMKLKPLGFKKKANTWTRELDSAYYVMFNAQKSVFSDEYYFNIYIGKNGTNEYGDCYYTRIAPQGTCPMDWQVLKKDEFEFFLNRTVVPALEQFLNTPLQKLGKLPSIWSCCSCNRQKCEQCWVEKNCWD